MGRVLMCVVLMACGCGGAIAAPASDCPGADRIVFQPICSNPPTCTETKPGEVCYCPSGYIGWFVPLPPEQPGQWDAFWHGAACGIH